MARIDVYKRHRIGKVERGLFSTFVEHMGRSVYGGIYDPESPFAGADGFRNDVMELVKELGVDGIRYPGGNFLSGYDWKDGIGPKEERKARLSLSWKQTEPNTIGIHEFYSWAEKVGSKLILGVNMGTGTPKDAGEFVEYCNHPSGTYWSDQRIRNGKETPFAVESWCLGNEMDGDWQIGAKTAEEYGRIARETAKIMKWVDPNIRLTVCGSSVTRLPTYPEWDRVVLEHTYDKVDYLSLHKYVAFPEQDKSRVSDFLASFTDFNAFIKTGEATIEYVKTYKRSKKQVYISVDEWNIWHAVKDDPTEKRWQLESRRCENHYTALDAVVLASLLMTLINNCDYVKVACLAQLVNVLAPIFAEKDKKAIRQTTFYPFSMISRYAHGYALQTLSDGEKYDSVYGETPYIFTSFVHDDETGELTAFIINNRLEQAEAVEMNFNGFDGLSATESFTLFYGDKFDVNDFDAPDRVKMVKTNNPKKNASGTFVYSAPALSFSVVRFREEK